jgi:ribonuclease P protein component
MLDRKHRFHGYSSLKNVYPKTTSVRGSYISLRYANRPEHRPYRVAVVVGKKVHKSAVKRNRIRRRLYEAIRLSTNIPESTDLIFNVYSDQVAEMDFKLLSEQINDLLSKVTKT